MLWLSVTQNVRQKHKLAFVAQVYCIIAKRVENNERHHGIKNKIFRALTPAIYLENTLSLRSLLLVCPFEQNKSYIFLGIILLLHPFVSFCSSEYLRQGMQRKIILSYETTY